MYLEKLVDANLSLVLEPVGHKNVITVRVHPWPSWLTRGLPKLVDFILKCFYVNEVTDFERAPGQCLHC